MLATWAVNTTIKQILRILCKVDDNQLERVPDTGPLILVANHINFLEVPLVYTHLQPRPVTGFAKAETWDNPAMARLFDLWGAIPLRRGEADLTALRRGLEELSKGNILAMAPEGTRSGDGSLKKGYPGIALLAVQSGAPLLPVVYYGGEAFRQNIQRLRRTDFHISVGNPFHVHLPANKSFREVRQQMTDEIMYQLAALLPPAYRGYYAELSQATQETLYFPEQSASNLVNARLS